MTARKPARKAAATTPTSDKVGVRTGTRRGPTYTAVHDWVLYSTVSPTAKALYAVLRGHINDKRADDITWVSPTALALILQFSRGDKIGPYEKELIALGAISTEQVGMPAEKVYTVEQFPPRGYAGPISGKEWHDRNGDRVRELIEATSAARQARREKAKNAALVPPVSGGQAPPVSGGQVPLVSGGSVPPVSGRELTLGVPVVVKGDVRTTPSKSEEQEKPRTEEPKTDPLVDPNQESEETPEFVKSAAHWPTLTDWETALIGECLEVPGTRWGSRTLRKVLGSRTVREVTARDPELVRRAFLLGAADGGARGKTVPMRMWHIETCPHWKRAALGDVDNAEPRPTLTVVPAPRERAKAAPSRLQQDPEPSGPAMTREEARATARSIAEASKERRLAAAGASR